MILIAVTLQSLVAVKVTVSTAEPSAQVHLAPLIVSSLAENLFTMLPINSTARTRFPAGTEILMLPGLADSVAPRRNACGAAEAPASGLSPVAATRQ